MRFLVILQEINQLRRCNIRLQNCSNYILGVVFSIPKTGQRFRKNTTFWGIWAKLYVYIHKNFGGLAKIVCTIFMKFCNCYEFVTHNICDFQPEKTFKNYKYLQLLQTAKPRNRILTAFLFFLTGLKHLAGVGLSRHFFKVKGFELAEGDVGRGALVHHKV